MTLAARIELAALDTADTAGLSAFYAALTGGRIIHDDPEWTMLELEGGAQLAFQLAPDHVSPQWPSSEHPQQVHLDFLVDGLDAAAARALELGATELPRTEIPDGPAWVTLADPAGHPFDLCQRAGLGAVTQLYAVTIDAPDAPALGRFYAALLALEVTWEGPEGSMLSDGTTTVMIQQVSDYQAPHWGDPAKPQQAHLDIQVTDLDDGEARALELGAVRLDGGGETFRVFQDPAGHPFCLTLWTT